MPDTNDFTDAHMRRLLMITFPNQFEGIDADVKLKDKLTTQEELSGMFNILMEALRRILNTESIYQNDRTIQERRERHEKLNNPIGAFLEDANHQDATELDFIAKDDLYLAYQNYCKHHKLPIQKKETFGKLLKRAGCKDGLEGPKETRKRVWYGIKLTNWTNFDHNQTTIV